jgi:hypothetical protein
VAAPYWVVAGSRDVSGFEWMRHLFTSIRRDGERTRDDVATLLDRGCRRKPRAMLDDTEPAGTPDEVAAWIQDIVDAGVRHIVISPAAPEDTFEVMKLAATKCSGGCTSQTGLPERGNVADTVQASREALSPLEPLLANLGVPGVFVEWVDP